MIISEENYLEHYGTKRHSGRYPWGSTNNVQDYHRSMDFLSNVEKFRAEGLSDTEIARGLGMTTTQFRNRNSVAKNFKRQGEVLEAQRLKDKGWSVSAIGRHMERNESSVRAMLKSGVKDKLEVLETTTNMLRDQIASKKYLDVGSAIEYQIGVNRQKLNSAIQMLKEEGYKIHYVKIRQLGTGEDTTMKILSAPDVPYSEVYKNRFNIKQITDFSEDGGRSFAAIKEPISVNSDRIDVKYGPDGGKDADGVIYVRPGVSDVSIGSNKYAQVRIAVDGTHYLKGMAVYKSDLPKGVDLQFNTNKEDTGNKLDAMKKLKDDPDNPFGSIVRQIQNEKGEVTSAMNIVGGKEGAGEEGSWGEWSRNLPSQFLSKQSLSLAKGQLDLTYENKKADFDEIMQLTNPVVKKRLLESFADDVDSSAVHLKAAMMPRQATQVLLPDPKIKPTEVYAPNFRNGERVALVRFPHGGTFEIPELTVNNHAPSAKKNLGNVKDAVAINPKVAERLSGADFDGDTVLVIPNNSGRIKSTAALEDLKNFDPMRYKLPSDSPIPRMNARTKAAEMGNVSNLITDMTIKGANTSELARAVKHSMVVIDAEKHELNWKQSAIDNGISQLKEKYQGKKNAGASTLISKAKGRIDVPMRKARPASEGGAIDKATGKKMYVDTGESFVNREGKLIVKTFRSKKLAETDDAKTLSSGTPMESLYADHSNRLKALANTARKEMVHIANPKISSSSKKVYSNEVKSLDAKLKVALRNAPFERQAQVFANAKVHQIKQDNPDIEASELKKVSHLALTEARNRVDASRTTIDITPKEWDAIQSGAVSSHKLGQILNRADLEQVKKYATPKPKLLMTSTKKARAQAMAASGYTQAEIADALGVSLTTLKNSING